MAGLDQFKQVTNKSGAQGGAHRFCLSSPYEVFERTQANAPSAVRVSFPPK